MSARRNPLPPASKEEDPPSLDFANDVRNSLQTPKWPPNSWRQNAEAAKTSRPKVKMSQTPNRTPLGLAAEKGDINQVAEYINRGCHPDEEDGYLETPLYLAAGEGKTPLVRHLLSTYNADVNHQNWDGWTPLCWAVARGHKEVVKLLIEFQADVNLLTHLGWAPAHLAAMLGREDVLDILVEKGATVRVRNRHGCTVAYVAQNQLLRDKIDQIEKNEEEEDRRKAEKKSKNRSAQLHNIDRLTDATSFFHKKKMEAFESEIGAKPGVKGPVSASRMGVHVDKARLESPWPYSRELLMHDFEFPEPQPGFVSSLSFNQSAIDTGNAQKSLMRKPDIYRYVDESDDYKMYRVDYPVGGNPSVYCIANPKSVLAKRTIKDMRKQRHPKVEDIMYDIPLTTYKDNS